MRTVKVYGADWCGDTENTREHLDALGIDYDYFNIEQDQRALRWVKEQNDGVQKLPTVDVAGMILSIPEDNDLDDALRYKGLLG